MQQEVYSSFSALENKHWWFTARRKYLNKVISTFFDKKKNYQLCEIGCGTGGNLPMLSGFGTVEAVEMNQQARELVVSKKLNNVTKVHSGYLPDNLPLDKKFDGIFALDVIEHVKDDLSALKVLREHLNDDGFLITTVPAYQWLWSEHDVANHHHRRYTKKQYTKLIESAGYNIRYSSYYNSLLFPLAAVSRLLNHSKDSSLSMPASFINKTFKFIFGLESLWAAKLVMPFGLSIVVVAELKSTNHF